MLPPGAMDWFFHTFGEVPGFLLAIGQTGFMSMEDAKA
jgi:hypothetical protein